MTDKEHKSDASISFEEVWKSLEEQDKNGVYKRAREMAGIAREQLEYAFNHGYETAKAKYERPQGEWIMQLHNCDGEFYTCSVCRRMIRVSPYVEDNETLKDYPFCHCGADMRGEEE